MGSFFRNQTFPENWHRRSSPATFDDIAASLDEIYEAHPISPGANSPNGTYIEDGLPGVSLCVDINTLQLIFLLTELPSLQCDPLCEHTRRARQYDWALEGQRRFAYDSYF
jgi:hypothetical protein